MRDYPNMSYCMCENTALAINQILSAMEDAGSINQFIDTLSFSEARAFLSMIESMRTIVDVAEDEGVSY